MGRPRSHMESKVGWGGSKEAVRSHCWRHHQWEVGVLVSRALGASLGSYPSLVG